MKIEDRGRNYVLMKGEGNLGALALNYAYIPRPGIPSVQAKILLI